MEIKKRKSEKTPFDIKEWNEEVNAFIRPLNGFEALVFNDYFYQFYNRTNEAKERYNAGFDAAKLCLVDENDTPLLVEDDREIIEDASFAPLFRLFAEVLKDTDEPEGTKKN